MPRATRAVLLGVVFLCAPASASAQITSPYRFVEESQSVSVFAGYLFTNTGSAELGPRSGPVFGARYAIRVTGPFTFEGDAGLVRSDRVIRDTIPTNGGWTPVAEADLSLLLINGTIRFNLTGPRTFHDLLPYLMVGFGAAIQVGGRNPPEEAGLHRDKRFEFGTRFAAQLGGGVEWFWTRRTTLRLDLRNVLWQLDSPLMFLDVDPTLPTTEWVQNFSLTLGAGIRF